MDYTTDPMDPKDHQIWALQEELATTRELVRKEALRQASNARRVKRYAEIAAEAGERESMLRKLAARAAYLSAARHLAEILFGDNDQVMALSAEELYSFLKEQR